MAKLLSYSYVPFSIIDNKSGKVIGEIFRPLVTVKFSYLSRKTFPFEAIVDSGSDCNLLPAHVGEDLGINFKNMEPRVVEGIGGFQVKVYRIKVSLWFLGEEYPVDVEFSYEQSDPVLGRKGFFDLFESVSFKEKERFTVISLK